MRFDRLILLGCLLMAGCGSARVAEEPGSKVYRAPKAALRGAQAWTPSYIATGLSTGIMISAAGTNGERIMVDLWRYPIETTEVVVIEPVRDPSGRNRTDDRPVEYLEIRTPQVVLAATVNDLGQTFVKVPPGTYLLHPRLAHLPNIYVAGVEVHEGSYALVPIRPEGARAASLRRDPPEGAKN